MATWYYGSGGGQHGPVDEGELRAMIASGAVGPATLVWRDGMRDWLPVQALPELCGAVTGPYPPYYPPPAGSTSGLAIASMVCGIAGYLTCYFVGILGIPAVICGHMALARIRDSPVPVAGRGMAVAGLILGYLGILLTLAVFSLFIIAIMAGKS